MGTTDTAEFGEESVTGERLWTADFSDSEAFWTITSDDDAEYEFRGDELHLDVTGGGGAYCWYPHEFPEDILITYEARVPEFRRSAVPGDEEFNGRNLNCLFAASEMEAVADSFGTRSGDANAEETTFDELANYFLTVTYKHTRLRKSPGRTLKSELLLGVEYPEHTYEIAVLKRGDRIAASIDGRLVHDWTDPEPLGRGWVGLVTWSTAVTYEDWSVSDPT